MGVAGVMFYVAAITSLLAFVGGGVNVMPLLILGVAALVCAAGLGIAGGIVLSNTLKERRERTLELRELERRLKPAEEAPEPPPSSVQGPAPAVLLATF